jgi:hypothetical protein
MTFSSHKSPVVSIIEPRSGKNIQGQPRILNLYTVQEFSAREAMDTYTERISKLESLVLILRTLYSGRPCNNIIELVLRCSVSFLEQ